MRFDRPIFGILLMVGFCVSAPLGDAMAKLAGTTVPLLHILVVRFAAQAVLLLPVMWWTGKRLFLSRHAVELTVLRSVLHILGLGTMYMSFWYLPLADAIAMVFVMPFIMLMLGWLVMGEQVGVHRLAACSAGFVGTLLVIQPSFAVVGAPALLPLLVALIFALFMLVTRKLAKENDPVTLQVISGMVSTVLLAPLAFYLSSSGMPGSGFAWASVDQWLLLTGVGVLGTVGHLLMTFALRFAPSATLAPIQYLEIPIATMVGWLVFQDLPHEMAALGIAVIMGAGLYILLVERAAPQRIAPQT